MSQEVASLVRQRAVIKSRLTNFKKFLDACTADSLDDAAICELEQKVERINLANEEFAGIQCQIESLVEDLEEQITERDLVEIVLTKLNVSQRYEKLKEKKACMNCLRLGHFSRQCRASGCKRCSAKHNTLLHFEKTNSSVPENSEQAPATLQTATAKSEPPATAAASAASADAAGVVFIRTQISDKDGNPCQGRAVLDSGSQSNYITKEFCNRLGIPVTNVHFALSGINENALIAKAKSLTFYVLPTITGHDAHD
nr:unnamed protein product [Callosobruchus analis]